MTATWPADWDAMLAGRDCSMCAKGRPDDDGFGVRIQAAKYSDAYLQRADMQRGYTLVIWRGRHVAEPTEPIAFTRSWSLLRSSPTQRAGAAG